MIIEDSFLRDVCVENSEAQGKFDAVAKDRDTTRVLKTFDTAAEAKTWINALGDKLVAEDAIAALDVRNG